MFWLRWSSPLGRDGVWFVGWLRCSEWTCTSQYSSFLFDGVEMDLRRGGRQKKGCPCGGLGLNGLANPSLMQMRQPWVHTTKNTVVPLPVLNPFRNRRNVTHQKRRREGCPRWPLVLVGSDVNCSAEAVTCVIALELLPVLVQDQRSRGKDDAGSSKPPPVFQVYREPRCMGQGGLLLHLCLFHTPRCCLLNAGPERVLVAVVLSWGGGYPPHPPCAAHAPPLPQTSAMQSEWHGRGGRAAPHLKNPNIRWWSEEG